MSQNPSSTELPPVLALLRDTPPGMLYSLATKNELLEGMGMCVLAPITDVSWSDDRSILHVEINGSKRQTLAANGGRLEATCSCRRSAPGRYCEHLVATWVMLKRLVSPNTFPQLRFNENHINNVAYLIGLKRENPAPERAPVIDILAARLARARGLRSVEERATPAAPAKPKELRLVLEKSGAGVRGIMLYGTEQLYPWVPAPAELQQFTRLHYSFEPTIRFFEDYEALSGTHPIIFRGKNGQDTLLTWQGGSTLHARVTFALDRGNITISRHFADGYKPSREALIADECLVDPEAGTIRPIQDAMAWRMAISMENDLKAAADSWGEKIRHSGRSFTVSAELFNFASIRLRGERMKEVASYCHFLAGGTACDPLQTSPSTYHLEILDDVSDETIGLAPMGEAVGAPFPLSRELFWLFDPEERSAMSQPLRAKKRVTAMIEAGFAALEAPNATARTTAIRTALNMTDFPKRPVKTEATRIVKSFVQNCANNQIVLRTRDNVWCFAQDNRAVQAKLMRILYRFFGLDAFVDGLLPGEMELPSSRLLPRLGELAAALRLEGFELRIGQDRLNAGTWDFHVEASRHAIDWFELKPEIRCNGELLEMEEIRKVLEEGILRQGNACYLLDDDQRRILEMLFGKKEGKGKKRKKDEIVRIPRLQILDWLELRAHGVTLRLPPEDEQLIASLTRLEQIPEIPLPEKLNATLRHYQREGYDWLAFLYRHRFGACLADDMGLGKTIQAITFMAGIAEGHIPSAGGESFPHLIVVPPSLLFNWESEIARFYPDFRVLTYAGQKRVADFTDADIVLTSYGILQRDIDMLAGIPFHVAIFDEAQQVKNLQAATTGAARRVSARFKVALTGTPMENHLGEYFAIMDLCVSGLLGNYEEFRRKTDIRGFGGIDTLVRRTRPFILRRSKQMIADELPPRVEADLYLEMTPKQRALYQKTVEQVKGAIDEAFRAKAPGQARMIALTAILRLRQICLSPALITAGGKGDSPKLECLVEQLEELRDEGHSSLVFSQFTSYLDIVEEGLKRHKLPYLRLDGSTPVVQRKALVNRFQQSGEPLTFLISLKAGGKGLNLTRATYVYHLDPWWNPAVENQASDRAHRIGQTARVTVTRLLMRHTVEEKMMALKERKLQLYKALLDDASGAGGASLSKEDFDFLLAP